MWRQWLNWPSWFYRLNNASPRCTRVKITSWYLMWTGRQMPCRLYITSWSVHTRSTRKFLTFWRQRGGKITVLFYVTDNTNKSNRKLKNLTFFLAERIPIFPRWLSGWGWLACMLNTVPVVWSMMMTSDKRPGCSCRLMTVSHELCGKQTLQMRLHCRLLIWKYERQGKNTFSLTNARSQHKFHFFKTNF